MPTPPTMTRHGLVSKEKAGLAVPEGLVSVRARRMAWCLNHCGWTGRARRPPWRPLMAGLTVPDEGLFSTGKAEGAL
jgi:hypothetical protein